VAIESKCNARLSLANNFSKKKKLQWQECKTFKELCKKINPKN
jgi:hypothetical protein